MRSTASTRFEPQINAFVLVDADGALAAARASEARWAKGEPMGLVDGLPATIKDIIDVKGKPTRKGSLTTRRDAGGARRARGRAAQGTGRRHPRQDLHAGIRLDRRLPFAADRHHPQSLEPDAHHRRLFRRRGGGGAAQSRHPASRHRRRRLDPHSVVLHRRVRHQAELRPRAGLSGLGLHRAGASGPAHPHGRRRRA